MGTKLTHLDEVQGKSEARKGDVHVVLRLRTGAFDAAIRQERLQSFWLCQKVGSRVA